MNQTQLFFLSLKVAFTTLYADVKEPAGLFKTLAGGPTDIWIFLSSYARSYPKRKIGRFTLLHFFPCELPPFELKPLAMVGVTGFEPVTLRLSSACSNQLSFRPVAGLARTSLTLVSGASQRFN